MLQLMFSLIILLANFIPALAQKELKGTCVLTGSEDNMTTNYLYDLYLLDLSNSPCMASSSESAELITLNNVTHNSDSTVSIVIKVWANCSHDFLGELKVEQDSILTLVYHGYGGWAMCSCCFELTYTIRKKYNYDGNLNFKKVKHIMIDGFPGTLTAINWNR